MHNRSENLPQRLQGWRSYLNDEVPGAQHSACKMKRNGKNDNRSARCGVSEPRFFIGSRYRVYIGLEGDTVVILLCGGDKGSQDGDIETAKAFWKDNQRGKTHENG